MSQSDTSNSENDGTKQFKFRKLDEWVSNDLTK